MLRIGKMADYALLITQQLASTSEQLSTMEDLAERSHLPMATVRKLLRLLVAAHIVNSHRGVNGGYQLARPAQELKLAEVLNAVDGPIAITECCHEDEGTCDFEPSCNLKCSWNIINEVVITLFKYITIADLTKSGNEQWTRINDISSMVMKKIDMAKPI